MNPSDQWLARLSRLRVSSSRERGKAPHKPLLLFCLLDLIEAGELPEPWLVYGPDLVFRFQNYWPIVLARQKNRPDVRLPFHHLSGDLIWSCQTESGDPSAARQTTARVELDPILWTLLQDPAFRLAARRTLIESYFQPGERIAFYAQMDLEEPASAELLQIRENRADYDALIERGRSGRFRTEVCTRYRHTCALTGYRCTTTTANIVEAAHIEAHRVRGNNDIRNGLALTPNAHWMFDQGLWTVEVADSALRILVARDAFHDDHPEGWSLRHLHHRPLTFAPHATLRPDPDFLHWHRKQVFQR